MNPNAAEKSLNSNTRCRLPFTTRQPFSFRNSTDTSFSVSFVAAMNASTRLAYCASVFLSPALSVPSKSGASAPEVSRVYSGHLDVAMALLPERRKGAHVKLRLIRLLAAASLIAFAASARGQSQGDPVQA